MSSWMLLTASLLLASEIVGPDADFWEAFYLQGQKIGHSHTTTERVDAGGQAVLRTRYAAELTTRRFDDVSKTTMNVETYELPDGTLYASNSRMKAAEEEQKSVGRLGQDGKFRVSVSTPGKTEEQVLEWSPDVRSLFALERELRERPLAIGETRSRKVFLTDLNQVATETVKAIRKEKTELPGGETRELLLVEETNDKVPLVRSLWLDEEGRVRKARMPVGGLEMVSYRVPKEVALGEAAGESFDLGRQTLVRPDRPIPKAHATKAVEYAIRSSDAETAASIPESTYQKVLGRDGATVRVRVERREPPPPPRDPAVLGAASEFLESNGFIQSDDPRIIELARKIVGDEADVWEKAQRLEKWVHENMTQRDFSIGFATASEVARTRRGDCTEHAVLLAALCRAVGIPSRVAIGLVYLEGTGAFGYHMWTEIQVAGSWYALDGTLGQGSIGGGHIKLADGSLKGVAAMSTVLPVLQLLGKLDIKVEKIEGP